MGKLSIKNQYQMHQLVVRCKTRISGMQMATKVLLLVQIAKVQGVQVHPPLS